MTRAERRGKNLKSKAPILYKALRRQAGLDDGESDDSPSHITYAIDGDKLGKAERKGGSGFGVKETDVMYTETAKDVHGVAYVQPISGPLLASGYEKNGTQEALNDMYVCFPTHGYGNHVEDDLANCLTAEQCNHIRGDSPLICQSYGFDGQTSRDAGKYIHKELANTVTNGTCPGYHNNVCSKIVNVERERERERAKPKSTSE